MTRALKSILMNFDCGGVRPKLLCVAKVGPPRSDDGWWQITNLLTIEPSVMQIGRTASIAS